MTQIKGKSVLVTGGGSGIGLAVAAGFLAEGARVAITGRDAGKLRKAADSLAGGDRLIYHAADVGVPEQVEALTKKVSERFGQIDILVNNAGMNIKARTLRQLTAESWRQLISANLDGAFYCTQAVLPQMFERHDGLVIFISSI